MPCSFQTPRWVPLATAFITELYRLGAGAEGDVEKNNTRTDMSPRYTAAKRALLANTLMQDDVKTHMLSSLVAGTVATTICAPADVLKSRIQAASKSGAGSSVSPPLPPTFHIPQAPAAFMMNDTETED